MLKPRFAKTVTVIKSTEHLFCARYWTALDRSLHCLCQSAPWDGGATLASYRKHRLAAAEEPAPGGWWGLPDPQARAPRPSRATRSAFQEPLLAHGGWGWGGSRGD